MLRGSNIFVHITTPTSTEMGDPSAQTLYQALYYLVATLLRAAIRKSIKRSITSLNNYSEHKAKLQRLNVFIGVVNMHAF